MPSRAIAPVIAAVIATALLAGCARAVPEEPSAAPATGAPGEAFPVTIDHAFGSTTIEEAPERVVTLGWSAQDIVYALGVEPVGMPSYTYGGDEDGVLPWNAELYDPATTTLLDTTDGPPLEAIAALRPDVILAPYDGFDQPVYDQLTAIAPTVAYPGEPWTTPWREQTRIVGEALGMPEEAEALVADVEATLEQTAADRPELDGLTFAYTSFGAETLYVYLPADPRVELVESLGMVPAPSVEELAAANEGQFYAEVSPERATEVSSQVLIGFADELGVDGVTSHPVYSRLPALQQDAAVLIDDQAFAAAVSSVSVLSIPWSMERLVDRLSTAARNAT